MAGKHTFIIEGKTRGVDKSKQKVKGLSGALGGLATKALSVGAAYFAAKGLINGISSSLKLYAEQELAETKLRAALGKQIGSLQKYASSLQQTTRFGDELILQGMAQLAFFIKDEKQLKIATKATLDLASAKGMDLVQAADLVAKSVGSSTNALSRYGIAADGAVGSEERLLSITDEIANLFGGQAEATTDSYQGAIDQLSNAFGDMQEKIGEAVAPAIRNLAEGFTDLLSVPLSGQIEQDKTAMEGLFTVLKKSNISMGLRKDTLDAINEQYGQYLPDLLTEKSSLEDIEEAYSNISTALIQQIALEINKEEIREALKEEAKLRKEEAKLILEQEKTQSALNKAYAKQTEALKELEDVQIAGLETNSKYKDDTLEFEKMLISNVSAYDASGIAVNNATQANRDATEALNENRDAQQENRNSVISLNESARELATTYEVVTTAQKENSEFTVEQREKADNAWTDYYNKNIASQEEQLKLERDVALKSVEASEDAAEAKHKINKKYNLLLHSTKSQEVGTIIGGFGEINKAIGGEAEITKALMISQAIASTYAGATKALAQGGMFGWGQAAMITAAGIANVKKIEAAQYGFSGIVDEPTMFLAGEGGQAETVNVTPLEGPNLGGPQGGGVTVNVSGNVMSDDFAENELSARISEAFRRGVDFGMS